MMATHLRSEDPPEVLKSQNKYQSFILETWEGTETVQSAPCEEETSVSKSSPTRQSNQTKNNSKRDLSYTSEKDIELPTHSGIEYSQSEHFNTALSSWSPREQRLSEINQRISNLEDILHNMNNLQGELHEDLGMKASSQLFNRETESDSETGSFVPKLGMRENIQSPATVTADEVRCSVMLTSTPTRQMNKNKNTSMRVEGNTEAMCAETHSRSNIKGQNSPKQKSPSLSQRLKYSPEMIEECANSGEVVSKTKKLCQVTKRKLGEQSSKNEVPSQSFKIQIEYESLISPNGGLQENGVSETVKIRNVLTLGSAPREQVYKNNASRNVYDTTQMHEESQYHSDINCNDCISIEENTLPLSEGQKCTPEVLLHSDENLPEIARPRKVAKTKPMGQSSKSKDSQVKTQLEHESRNYKHCEQEIRYASFVATEPKLNTTERGKRKKKASETSVRDSVELNVEPPSRLDVECNKISTSKKKSSQSAEDMRTTEITQGKQSARKDGVNIKTSRKNSKVKLGKRYSQNEGSCELIEGEREHDSSVFQTIRGSRGSEVHANDKNMNSTNPSIPTKTSNIIYSLGRDLRIGIEINGENQSHSGIDCEQSAHSNEYSSSLPQTQIPTTVLIKQRISNMGEGLPKVTKQQKVLKEGSESSLATQKKIKFPKTLKEVPKKDRANISQSLSLLKKSSEESSLEENFNQYTEAKITGKLSQKQKCELPTNIKPHHIRRSLNVLQSQSLETQSKEYSPGENSFNFEKCVLQDKNEWEQSNDLKKSKRKYACRMRLARKSTSSSKPKLLQKELNPN